MFNIESDNHGYINRATWLAALWYLDEIENMRDLSILNDDKPIMFDTPEEIMYYIESELDQWAAETTVMDAHLEKVELYYLLPEVDTNELLEQLRTKKQYTKENQNND